MTSVAVEPPLCVDLLPPETVEAHVRRLLSATYPPVGNADRRADQRFPFAQLSRLRPVASDGAILGEPASVAVAKHISERGIGFFHPEPMPHRRVAVEIEIPERGEQTFVVELTWCRFTQHGWYESGGRFLTGPSPRAGDTP